MGHTVRAVEAEPDFILTVDFEDGSRKKYDIKPLFDKWEAFEDLRDIRGLYPLVKVDPGGYGISWNDDIDLASEELWEHGIIAETIRLEELGPITDEEIRQVEEAARRPVVYDEDSPKPTPEMEEAFRAAARERNRRKSRSA